MPEVLMQVRTLKAQSKDLGRPSWDPKDRTNPDGIFFAKSSVET